MRDRGEKNESPIRRRIRVRVGFVYLEPRVLNTATGPLSSCRPDIIERTVSSRFSEDRRRRRSKENARVFLRRRGPARADAHVRSTRLIRLTRGQADYFLGISHFSLCEEAKNYLTPVAVARVQVHSLYSSERGRALMQYSSVSV